MLMVKQRFRATSYDVAQAAGVSQSTVSRALSGDSSVSQATRERIREVAEQLNYYVDAAASRVRSGRIETIAVVVICPSDEDVRGFNPFHYALLGAVCAAASRRGLETLVSFQGAADRLDNSYERSRRAMGTIVIGTSENREAWDFFRQAMDKGNHIACWGAPHDDMAWVRADNVGGAGLAVDHLVNRGARRIVFLGETLSPQRQFSERREGYEAAMRERGLEPCVLPLTEGLSRHDQGRRAVADLLAQGVGFDGLFAACDDLALGAMAELRLHGLGVPDQVRIIGFDGIRGGLLAVPSLSTVAPDFSAAGTLLVDRLAGLIEGRADPETRARVALIARESS
jgi:DNA-binding LacI/PurR family transcriptional regulator